jgi:hypothetical protein
VVPGVAVGVVRVGGPVGVGVGSGSREQAEPATASVVATAARTILIRTLESVGVRAGRAEDESIACG